MGAPSSSTLSELYLKHLEHTNILIKHKITGYFRYVDDKLTVYDSDKTDISEALNSFNTASHPLNFTIEREKNNNQLNFLDITIKKENNLIKFEIYRKPTSTDILIPLESCHSTERKFSAIRYLQHRNNTNLTDTHKKQEQQIIHHILHNNHYDSKMLKKQNKT
jgi:hypothetical protein